MGRIIPICSALALLISAMPVAAKPSDASPLTSYVQARLAGSEGENAQAAQLLANVMTAEPDNAQLATRSWRQAVNAGNAPIALRAAMSMDRLGVITPDARILLYAESLRKGDWKAANQQLDRLEEGQAFSFTVPVLRAWAQLAAGSGDPIATLDKRSRDGLSDRFTEEHRGLILLALKRKTDGVSAISSLGEPKDRWVPLRLAAASRLIELRDGGAATNLLDGDDPAYQIARERIAAGKPMGGSVTTALAGTAALLTRISSDLSTGEPSPVALTLAQLASFISKPDSNTRLVRAQALSQQDRTSEALQVLDGIAADDPFALRAGDLRFTTLIDGNKFEEGLNLATMAAEAPNASWRDHAHRGEALSRMEKHGDSATAYGRAIEVYAAKFGAGQVPWNLWLLYGQELDQSGQWQRAKPALRKAIEAGPDQPSPLNYLGYSMLEAGDDPGEALRLISRASAMRPDDAAITDSLGWAYFRTGQVEKALPVLERAFAMDPTISEIAEHLGDAYWTDGQRVFARYTWRAALLQAEGEEVKRIEDKLDRGLVKKAI